MAQIRINTRSGLKEKPYMINSQFLQNWEGKNVIGWAKYVYVVSEICAEWISVPGDYKMWKVGQI